MLRWTREEKQVVNFQPVSIQELRKFMREINGQYINNEDLTTV